LFKKINSKLYTEPFVKSHIFRRVPPSYSTLHTPSVLCRLVSPVAWRVPAEVGTEIQTLLLSLFLVNVDKSSKTYNAVNDNEFYRTQIFQFCKAVGGGMAELLQTVKINITTNSHFFSFLIICPPTCPVGMSKNKPTRGRGGGGEGVKKLQNKKHRAHSLLRARKKGVEG
jgi:hypothetical protein